MIDWYADDDEDFCPRCCAGTDSSEHQQQCSAAQCLCSHAKTNHVTDRRGRVVCRSAACGCAEFRPGGSK